MPPSFTTLTDRQISCSSGALCPQRLIYLITRPFLYTRRLLLLMYPQATSRTKTQVTIWLMCKCVFIVLPKLSKRGSNHPSSYIVHPLIQRPRTSSLHVLAMCWLVLGLLTVLYTKSDMHTHSDRVLYQLDILCLRSYSNKLLQSVISTSRVLLPNCVYSLCVLATPTIVCSGMTTGAPP